MAVPIATIVKKVATTILFSNKEEKDKFLVVIGSLLAAIVAPMILVVMILASLFSSDSLVDNSRNNFRVGFGHIIENADLTTMAISATLTDAGCSDTTVRTATNIFTLYYLSYSAEENFVSRYTNCFMNYQNAGQLTSNLNSTFGTSLTVDKISAVIDLVSSTYISTSGYYDLNSKNNRDLVHWARNAALGHWGYVWGTYGNVLTRSSLQSLAEMYPDHVGSEQFYDFIESHYIGRRTVDCAGLIKSYMWYDFNAGVFNYGGNGFADGNTEALFSRSTVNGTIDTIPEIPGIAVYHSGHVGVYIGDGVVIEAMGTRYGVVKTRLSDGSWTNWFMIPGLTYIEENSEG